MRLIPLVFLLIMSAEFMLMLRVAEPYPAVILPPFHYTSDRDTLTSYRFEVYAFGANKRMVRVDYRSVFDFAPPMTGFFLLRTLPEEGADMQLSTASSDDYTGLAKWLRDVVVSSRLRSLSNSDEAYAEAKIWLRGRLESIT